MSIFLPMLGEYVSKIKQNLLIHCMMKHIIGLLSIPTDFIILLYVLFVILDGCCFDYVFIGVVVEKPFVFKDTLMLLPL